MKIKGSATVRQLLSDGCRRGIADRRGVVAVLVGFLAPVLVMALGLGIEVSRWAVVKVELQRIADAAALAGAFDYEHQTTNASQTAVAAALNLAELNGITAPVAAQIVAGPRNPNSDTAVRVTVSRQVPLFLAQIFTSATSQTISATAVAELIPAATGAAACMLALQGSVNGVDPPVDITLSGNALVTGSNCVLRSNGDVNLNGNAEVTAAGIVAAGVVSSSKNQVTGSITQNAGQISDPFASDTALTDALAEAAQIPTTTTGVSCSTSGCTGPSGCCVLTSGVWQIQPGSSSGISADGTVTLSLAGLYLVNGDVSFAGQAAVTGTGVSIVATGTGSFDGKAAESFTAATPATAGNSSSDAIPGVVFATSSSGITKYGGKSSFPFTGAIYAPNGTLQFAGNATDGASGCGEVVAYDVTLTGNAQFASNCLTYGLPTIPSQLTFTAELVQ
jgi:Flp pilus assembly protein TadG